MRCVQPGALYFVEDETLLLLPREDRKLHDTRRPVVVVSGAQVNANADWPFVLCCPLSTSTTRKTEFCVPLSGQEAVGKKTWGRVPAIQPIMKSDLQDFIHEVPEHKRLEIQARIVQYLGIVDQADEASSD